MNKKIILLPVIICLILFGCSVPDAELVAPVWNISLKKIPLLVKDIHHIVHLLLADG